VRLRRGGGSCACAWSLCRRQRLVRAAGREAHGRRRAAGLLVTRRGTTKKTKRRGRRNLVRALCERAWGSRLESRGAHSAAGSFDLYDLYARALTGSALMASALTCWVCTLGAHGLSPHPSRVSAALRAPQELAADARLVSGPGSCLGPARVGARLVSEPGSVVGPLPVVVGGGWRNSGSAWSCNVTK
jgi:hypothetical protein